MVLRKHGTLVSAATIRYTCELGPHAVIPCIFHAAPTFKPHQHMRLSVILLQSLWHPLCRDALCGHQAGLPAGGQLQAHHQGELGQPCMPRGTVPSIRGNCRCTVQVSYTALRAR